MKLFFSIALFLLLCSFLYAQEDQVKINPSDFEGIAINRTEYYNGNSLWGYIDGGADLYLEYGFSKLTAQEILFKSKKYRVDIYRMNNAEAAFGIFSISKFKCSGKTVSKYSCLTDYQVLVAKGSYYISVTNEKGSAEEQKFTLDIAEKIIARINEADYITPPQFKTGSLESNLKFINGMLGLQNAVSDLEGMFADLKDFKFHISTVDEKEKYTTLAYITFLNSSDASVFFGRKDKRANELSKDVILKIKKDTENTIIYIETNKLNENKILSVYQ